jgi:hypothetical protein
MPFLVKFPQNHVHFSDNDDYVEDDIDKLKGDQEEREFAQFKNLKHDLLKNFSKTHLITESNHLDLRNQTRNIPQFLKSLAKHVKGTSSNTVCDTPNLAKPWSENKSACLPAESISPDFAWHDTQIPFGTMVRVTTTMKLRCDLMGSVDAKDFRKACLVFLHSNNMQFKAWDLVLMAVSVLKTILDMGPQAVAVKKKKARRRVKN